VKRKPLIWQLYPSYLVVTIVAVVLVGGYAASSLRRFYLDEKDRDLEQRAGLVIGQVLPLLDREDYPQLDRLCKQLGSQTGTRLTVILPSGRVVADSDENPDVMDNHLYRPEIVQAVKTGRGQNSRFSDTLKLHMMYVALAIPDNEQPRLILRTALPVTSISAALDLVNRRILIGTALVALAVAGVCWIIARRLSRPLELMQQSTLRFARGEFDISVPIPNSAEAAALAQSLNDMARQLSERIQTVTTQRNELEAVLSSMVEGVLAVDTRGNIMAVNQAAIDLLGLESQPVNGRNIYGLIRNTELNQFIEETLKSGRPAEKDVSLPECERFLRIHGGAIRDDQDRIIGAVVVLNDMTQLRRLENMRRDFVANVSHELKTPVTSIKGFVETLREDRLRDGRQAEKFLNIIAKQTDRLTAIIDDLLSLSRIEEETEKSRLTLTDRPLHPVLQSAIELTQVQAAKKQITVELDCPENLSARIDPEWLEQAVMNLIDNAVKYSPEGGTIHLQVKQTPDVLDISVRDDGCGIEKDHLSRIFERFYVVDKARSRKLGGTGLGLAIVKHVAQAHSGKVSVKSAPGQGSTFTIHLPTA